LTGSTYPSAASNIFIGDCVTTSNIPYVKAFINPSYLGLTSSPDWHECYIFAVTTLHNRPILWTVHLSTGAVFSRLPTQAISPVKTPKTIPTSKICDIWGSISEKSQVIRFDYLKDYEVVDLKTKIIGRYLFSIDFLDGAFAEDPEQHKVLHMVDFGDFFGLRANNMILFKDEHFVDEDQTIQYKRTSRYYIIGG
jgi:hypothetical protein